MLCDPHLVPTHPTISVQHLQHSRTTHRSLCPLGLNPFIPGWVHYSAIQAYDVPPEEVTPQYRKLMDCIIFPQYHICLQSLSNIRFVDNIQIIFKPCEFCGCVCPQMRP